MIEIESAAHPNSFYKPPQSSSKRKVDLTYGINVSVVC